MSYLGAPVLADDEVDGTVCFSDRTLKTSQFTEWERTL